MRSLRERIHSLNFHGIVLQNCAICKGAGRFKLELSYDRCLDDTRTHKDCDACEGTGRLEPKPSEVMGQVVIALAKMKHAIVPGPGSVLALVDASRHPMMGSHIEHHDGSDLSMAHAAFVLLARHHADQKMMRPHG